MLILYVSYTIPLFSVYPSEGLNMAETCSYVFNRQSKKCYLHPTDFVAGKRFVTDPLLFNITHVSCSKASQYIYIYKSTGTVIGYNDVETRGKAPTCFGLSRSSLERYLTKKNTIIYGHIIDVQ